MTSHLPPSASSCSSSPNLSSLATTPPLQSPSSSPTSSPLSFVSVLSHSEISKLPLSKSDLIAVLQKSDFINISESGIAPDMPHRDAPLNTDGDRSDDKSPSRRPILPLRQTSYSKRHASFDTPREVPLPRVMVSSLHQPSSLGTSSKPDSFQRIGSEHPSSNECSPEPTSSNDTPQELSSIFSEPVPDFAKEASRFDQLRHDRDSGYDSLEPPPNLESRRSPVLPNSRPFSTPDSTALKQLHLYAPKPSTPNWPPDRSSTASLPLPTSTPYHTLPAIPPTTLEEGVEPGPSDGWNVEAGGPSSPRSPPLSFPRGMFSSRTEPGMGQLEPPLVARSSSLPYDSLEGSFPMPPPDPPMILTPPPTTEPRPGAPHEPFLSHGPPPDDVWIAIETRSTEYRLVVRLPEFNRQAITIATRKRRILHIVADRWEAGGGHFERRVSFGYDADLAQVRAEFDGEHLLVRIPRRLPPLYVMYPKPRLR